MQKKIIALAVLAALSAPAFADTANVTVYGKAHLSLDSNGGNKDAGAGTKNGLNLTSNSSRLGFKGSEELADGLKAVFQYETEIYGQGSSATSNGAVPAPTGVSSTSTLFAAQRDTYLGVAGGFGTVVAGRLPLANLYANDANFFGDKVGDAGNFTTGGLAGLGYLAVPSRVSRAIAYVSPNFSGTTVTVGYVPNTAQSVGTTQNNLQKDSSFALRAAYDNNGAFASATYVSLGVTGIDLLTLAVGTPGAASPAVATKYATSGAKVTIFSLAGGYDFGTAKVRAQYVSTDGNSGAAASINKTDAKQSVFTIGGQFKLSDSDSIKAQIARASDAKLSGATVANSSATMVALGYDHILSKRTTVYAAFAKVNNGAGAQFSATGYAHGGVGTPGAPAGGVSYSPSALSFGMIHDF